MIIPLLCLMGVSLFYKNNQMKARQRVRPIGSFPTKIIVVIIVLLSIISAILIYGATHLPPINDVNSIRTHE